MIDESFPDRAAMATEMFRYYDNLIKRFTYKNRGTLLDMSGNIIWEEDYDAWQLRIKDNVDI